MEAAAKYSYNLCTEVSNGNNGNPVQGQEPAPSTSTATATTSGVSRLAPMRVVTTVLGSLRYLRGSKSTNDIGKVDGEVRSEAVDAQEEPSVMVVNEEASDITQQAEESVFTDATVGQEDSVIILEPEEERMDVDKGEEKFYEKLLEEEYKRLTEFVEEILPASDNPKEDLIRMYRSQIQELNDKIKGLQSKIHELEEKSLNEKEEAQRIIDSLKKQHEAEICSITQENWELIDDIIKSQIDEITLWRLEFDSISEQKGEPEAKVPAKNNKLAAQLLEKFKDLPTAQQGLMVVGMGVVTMVVGYYSWPFLVWAWPRLVAFAARIEVASVAAWLFTMMNSPAFKDFMKAWEDGEPLAPAFFTNFGPEIKSAIIAMAPKLFCRVRTVPVA